ncbi:hypothetical protein AB1Y20_022563 [Prymnesium parvum]|uniref:ABC transporter domain-containing protein n=1 Tax=Prymnesium parvum TaxID=97485 RepID=A0AB34JHY1_PRYPA
MGRGVAGAMLRVWAAEPKGRLLLAAWATTFVGVTVRTIVVRRRARRRLLCQPPPPAAAGAAAASAPSPLRRVLSLAIPSRTSRPVLYGAALSLSIGLRLALSIKMSQEIGSLGAMLSRRQWAALYRRQLTYALYAVPAALFHALMKYASSGMALSMRDHLTRQLHARYEAAGSLPLALAAAEDGVQMGTADLAACCSSLVSLFEGLFKPTFEVLLLSAKLASMMGLKQLLHCYAFFAAAGAWTRLVGPSFETMSVAAQAAEGELLAHRSRLHAYAEEVTMLRGAPLERQLMDEAADSILLRTRRLHFQRFLSEALDGYVLRYLGILAAFTAMLPAVVDASAGRSSASDEPTEYFLTCLHLLVNVGMALKDLVLSHKAAASTRGLATRVVTLLDALEAATPPLPPPPPSAAPPLSAIASPPHAPLLLRVHSLSIATPAGGRVLHSLDLQLGAGQRLLLCGANGSGKSSLFRVLSGVWPAASGEAEWLVPPSDRLVLPQRPYLVPAASARLNLLYPTHPASAPRRAEGELLAALAAVGLAGLPLDVAGACEGLSPGEQQRLCLARLLLRAPAVALLDEPCAAVDPSFEMKFFEECARRQMTLITVSHRREAAVHFTHKLRLDGAGGATLRVIDSNKGDDSSASDDFVHAES